ncbi:hypothetical protein [Azonexus sp.]|uniref:hypothetical protein n=1 Tax=Azonexus sp. TaxID=1872668 RepID=UPI0027BAB19F|nr:hypothetical protein [Azonexus sp.]
MRLSVLKPPGFWRALALALLLLCAQQLMLAHGVEHLAEQARTQGEPAEILCHDCLAFNHLPDAPSGKSAMPPVLDGAACRVAGLVSLPVHGAACIAYAIRAPPFLSKQA